MRALLLVTALIATTAFAQGTGDGRDRYLLAPETSFILDNVRLIDGTGAPARENMTVVVVDGRITHVGASVENLPTGARRLDLSGHTVMPGLVMMHEHMSYFSGAYVWDSQPGSVPKLLLAAGVTTVRTAGAEAPQVDLNLKQRIDSGRAVGPRLYVTGGYINGPEGGFLGDNVVETADAARSVTAFWAGRGATSIKVYSAISADALRAAVEEAERRNIHVAGHLGELSCGEAADAGIHTIEHSLSSCVKDLGIDMGALADFRYEQYEAAADRLITQLVARNVTLVATPPTTEPYEPTTDELAMLSPDQLQRYREFVRSRPPWLPPLSAMSAWNDAHRRFERAFVAAGGRLLVGADASDFGLVPGYANHAALIALVRAGFTPLEAIRFATADAADFLGAGDRLGTVAVGKVADLLIVRGAPDRNIQDIRNVTYVFKEGRAYDPARLRDAARGQLGMH